MAPAGRVRAFLSYAHEDFAWRDALLGHLGWLRQSGKLEVFCDPQIELGRRWDGIIRDELKAAELVFVLAWRHFFASSFCVQGELMPALARHEHGCVVIPIICRRLDLDATPLGAFQCLPSDPTTNNLKPLEEWATEVETALATVTAKVRGIMDRLRPAVSQAAEASASTAPVPAGIPPRGRFIGRETDLDQLRAWILDDAPQPIAILGPGGIGKSKLSIAALHDAEIATRFGDRRLFVRLEDVRDEAGIYGAVARELAVEPGARPAATVATALLEAPIVVVLDNAETPWEADLAGAEQAFANLAELPGVRLAVSLRGYELPGVADWRPILIEPLPADPARALFLAIARGRYATDPALPGLLRRLDGLPLAIELVAHRAQTETDAATVLRQWEAERGRFPSRGQGGRKEHDLAARSRSRSPAHA